MSAKRWIVLLSVVFILTACGTFAGQQTVVPTISGPTDSSPVATSTPWNTTTVARTTRVMNATEVHATASFATSQAATTMPCGREVCPTATPWMTPETTSLPAPTPVPCLDCVATPTPIPAPPMLEQAEICHVESATPAAIPADGTFTFEVRNTPLSLAWSPSGDRLAVAGGNAISLYAPGDSTKQEFMVESREITSITFDSAGTHLAAGTWEGAIYLWALSSPSSPRILENHTERVRNLAFHPDGSTLASGGGRNIPGVAQTPSEGFVDTDVRLWDVQTGELMRRLAHEHGSVQTLAYSDDSSLLSAGTSDTLSGRSFKGVILRWRTDSYAALPILPAGQTTVFDRSGTVAATANRNVEPAAVWDLTTGDAKATLRLPGWAYDLIMGNDGASVIAGTGSYGFGASQAINVWDLAANTVSAPFIAGGPLAVSPDGTLIVAGDGPTADCGDPTSVTEPRDMRVRLFGVGGSDPLAVLETNAARTADVAFSLDGRRLAVADLDGTIYIWNRSSLN